MLIIGNGTLITHDNDIPLIENGALLIDGEIISEIGDSASLRNQHPDAQYIDADGGLIMPGLINAHCHIYSAFARGLGIDGPPNRNFPEILENLWWNIDRHMTPEDVAYSAYWTYLDSIRNGCTTIFDHHASYGAIEGSLFAISNAAEKLGLRTSLCYEVSDRDGDEKMRKAVKENAEYIKYASKLKHQRGMMGMHASFTMSDSTLEYCMKNTPDGVGCHIHVAEGMTDVYDCLSKHDKRVIQRLHDFGILGEKTVTGHCIHISPLEMDIIKETNTIIVHNPQSNMGNAVGCPPTMEQMRRGILVGLGTDGYTNDMFESMKAAGTLHRHNLCDPTAAWAEVPQMLFRNNAEITKRIFGEEVGILKKWAAADVIISDYIPQTPLHAGNIYSHILFGLTGRSITTTVASGKILMLNRKMLIADEQEIYAKCRELTAKLEKRINS